LPNKDIAERLVISNRTVLFHKGNIYEKLGIADLQQAHRQRELGKFCQALDAAAAEESSPAPVAPEPDPVQPSMRALAAVEEDNKALTKQRLEEEQREQARRRALVPHAAATPQPWTRPPGPPIIPYQSRARSLVPVFALAAVAAVLAVALVVVLLTRDGETTVVERLIPVTPQPSTVTAAEESALATPTATTPPTATPTPTPPPPPTPQALSTPTFVVNSQPVGCHTDPSITAAVVAQRPVATLQTMDQLFRLPDGTWHRDAAQQCWVRTQPGPVELFTDEGRAKHAVGRLTPRGTVLYAADWSNGSDGWPTSAEWQVSRGQLLSKSDTTSHAVSPYQPSDYGIPDYAVEMEVQWTGFLQWPAYALIAREVYQGAIDFGYNCATINQRRWTRPAPQCSSGPKVNYKVERNQWHTLRLEVDGNTIVLKVNGAKLVEMTDNTELQKGRVAILNVRSQLSIRAFRVIKL
jgi:hypothetical protein